MLLKLVNIAAIFLVVVLLPEVVAHNSAYCYRQVLSGSGTRHVSVTTYATRASDYYTECGWWNWDTCRRTRYHRVSLTSYMIQHYPIYRSERYCCAGYTQRGTSCIPQCSPRCLHGECVAASHNTTGHYHPYGVCVCHVGWDGSDCRQAICSPHCLNGGTCISPGHCSCAHGYSGERCDEAECSPICLNGDCVQHECVCNLGWTGLDCRDAICSPHCLNGGTCITPGHCICQHGYDGYRCEQEQ